MNEQEKLLKVAEKLGYKTYIAPDHVVGCVWIATGEPLRNWQEFNPYDNPAQLVEAENYLFSRRWRLAQNPSGVWIWLHLPTHNTNSGVTRADAVINAIAGEDDEQHTPE